MDTFDLSWPGTTATLYTNGWRCRIIWRTGKQGMGGTIDNNALCKKRLAEGLENTPGLLEALRAAGHASLADEIAGLAPDAPAAGAAPAAGPAPAERARAPRRRAPTLAERFDRWVAGLPGETAWEATKNRRAKAWLELTGAFGPEGGQLLLKPPAARGKAEWVLKRVTDGSAEYVAAPSFRGLCVWLAAQADLTTEPVLTAVLAGLEGLTGSHPELAEAHAAWLAQREDRDGAAPVH